MQEAQVQIFIDGAVRYFKHLDRKDITVGTPFLADNEKPTAFDYTGIIGISGPNRGCVYFTAPSVLLKHLLMSLGEMDTQQEYLIDLVGEVANTISGNARDEFGPEFMISVPVVVEGEPKNLHLPKTFRSYVIPIYWKAYSAALVISLK